MLGLLARLSSIAATAPARPLPARAQMLPRRGKIVRLARAGSLNSKGGAPDNTHMKTATARQAGRRLRRGWSGICCTVVVAAAVALAGTATGQGNGKRNGNGKAEQPYPVSVSATPLPLNLEDPAQTSVGQLTYRGGFVLTANDPNFGGFSGLLVDPDGRGLLAITDRGYWFSADLVQGGDRLQSLNETYLAPILNWRGQPLESGQRDAEALARLDGRDGVMIAFEGWDRLWTYPAPTDRSFRTLFPILAQPMGGPADLGRQPSNGGVEAMTRLADGRLLMISEKAVDDDGRNRAWLAAPDGFSSMAFRAPAGYRPTDAAQLPDGDVLVLLRRYTPLDGASAQIVRVPLADIAPGAVLEGRTIAALKPPLAVDNMEALAVATAGNGRALLYLMSDNNFNAVQRTLLMCFELASG